MDDVRRRVQQDTLGHRGRARDPLYGIRRVLRRRRDRLSTKARGRLEAGLIAGDPAGEVTLAWTVAQDLMDLYQVDNPDQARARAETLIGDLRSCPIPELARLGRTLHAWRTELCAHFDHPTVKTENLNLKIKNTKRIARGYRNFTHYRLRLLLNHGRIREDHAIYRAASALGAVILMIARSARRRRTSRSTSDASRYDSPYLARRAATAVGAAAAGSTSATPSAGVTPSATVPRRLHARSSTRGSWRSRRTFPVSTAVVTTRASLSRATQTGVATGAPLRRKVVSETNCAIPAAASSGVSDTGRP